MIDLYAVQFEAEEPSSAIAQKQLRSTLELIERWIETAYQRQFGSDLVLPKDDFSLDLNRGRLISKHTQQTTDSDCGVISFIFTYPDKSDGNLLWTARINVARYGELLEFSLRLGIDSSQFVLAPVEIKVGRPQLIPNLLGSHQWTLGGTRLSHLPVSIPATDVEAFVHQRLVSKQRRLPIILISRVAETDELLADSRDIANHLAGIAEVYELADKWASFKLTQLIGRDSACYNGAVRIYWPKGLKTLSEFSPVILPRALEQSEANRTRTLLFKQLSQISALRFIDGPVTIDALEAIERERTAKADHERELARAAGKTDELIAIADEEIRELREINERLKKDAEQLRREQSLLAADLRTTQENLRAAWSPIPSKEDAEVEFPVVGTDPETVIAAVTEASGMYQATLVFHQKAYQSARDSPFKDPQEVSYALLAMHEVCLLLQESRKARKAIGRLEDLFAEKGFVYRAHESETSMSGKMGDERRIVHEGKKVQTEKHLALGKGGPDTCLRIHFFDDTDDGKFVIGHVGRHKTNTKT